MPLAAVRVCVGFDAFVIREGGWAALLGQLCPIGEPVGVSGGTEWTWMTERNQKG